MLSFRTVWVTHQTGLAASFDVYPPLSTSGNEPPEDTLYLTNAPAAFEDLFPAGLSCVVDITSVYALAFPLVPLDQLDQLFAGGTPSAERVWQVWKKAEAQLGALPLWALETIELVLRDLDECALARLIGHFAGAVRDSGVN